MASEARPRSTIAKTSPIPKEAGPLGAKARQTRPADRAEKSQQQAVFVSALCLGYTARFLGPCQAGLLSGTVYLWGNGCLEWEGERGWSEGGEQGSAPDQEARLSCKGQGV